MKLDVSVVSSKKIYLWLVGLFGLALHLGTALLRLNTFWPYPKLIDFGSFYAGAWAMAHNLSPYTSFADVAQQLASETGLTLHVPALNSFPVWPWLLRPFTHLSFPLAAWLWLGINLVLLGWCTSALANLARFSRGWQRWMLYLLVLTFGPVTLSLTLGQSSILLLALVLLVGRNLQHPSLGKTISAGILWIVGVSTKLFPVLWLPGLFLLRKWRELFTAIISLILLMAIQWIKMPQITQEYLFIYLPSRAAQLSNGSLDDQSLLAWLLRLTQPLQFQAPGLFVFQRHQVSWSPGMTVSSDFVWMITMVVLGGTGLWLAWKLWTASGQFSEIYFYLWVLFTLLILPHTERYNHVLLLPAMAWLWGQKERLFVVLAYVFAGLARLTHLWVLILPWPWAPIATGFGVMAIIVLMLGVVHSFSDKRSGFSFSRKSAMA